MPLFRILCYKQENLKVTFYCTSFDYALEFCERFQKYYSRITFVDCSTDDVSYDIKKGVDKK